MKIVFKKSFFSLLKKKPAFLLVLFFVGLGLLFPLFPAHGQFGWMGDIAESIGEAIGSIIAKFWSAILAAILTPAAIILAWSIDPWFIKIPYTSGAIVDIGWPVTRDLANMFIVLVLVVIGLATALRLEEYQARKTLPNLLLIALLINFTPVILGVIVDFTNIVMNFFLAGLTGSGALADTFLNINASIASSLSGFNFFDPVEFMSFVIKLMVMTLFMIFAAIIFILFALLFIMRRVAIWILVILSPIAFIAYVLPATRGFFRFWWSQFVNWAIIGIFASFFLWLGDHMIGFAAAGSIVGSAGSTNPVTELINDVLPYGIALIFLLIGFFAALSTSAMGSAGVISGARSIGRAAPGAIAGFAGSRAADWGKRRLVESPAARRISRRWSRGESTDLTSEERALPWYKKALKPTLWAKGGSRLAASVTTLTPEEKELSLGQKLKKPTILGKTLVGGVTAPVRVAGKAVGRAGIAVREGAAKDVNRLTKEIEGEHPSPEGKFGILRDPTRTDVEKIAAFNAVVNADQQKALKKMGWTIEEKDKIGKAALRIDHSVFDTFKKAYPKTAIKIAKEFPEEIQEEAGMKFTNEAEEKKYNGNVLNKLIAGAKPDDIKKMAPDSWKDIDVKTAMHEFWDGTQIRAAATAFGKEFVEEFNRGVQIRGEDWYKSHNPKVSTYVHRTTSQELGFQDPIKFTREQVPAPGASLDQRLKMASDEIEWLNKKPTLTLKQTAMKEALAKEVEEIKTEVETIKGSFGTAPRTTPPGKKGRWAGRKY